MSVVIPPLLSSIKEEFPDLEIEIWEQTGRNTLPKTKDHCRFYVPGYMSGRSSIMISNQMPQIEVVQLLTAGVDGVRSLIPQSATLCNAKGVHDASTAELAVALALNARRGLDGFHKKQMRGVWQPKTYPSLADSKVLIVGYGSIGAALERRLLPFEVEITRVTRRARQGTHEVTDLLKLLPDADVVFLLVPLTPETEGFYNAAMFEAMKPGSVLVNVARGPVVDTKDLLNALKVGKIFAAIDVVDPEPLPPDHPLWTMDNCIVTPHIGGNSTAFYKRAHQLVMENLARFISHEPLLNVISGEY
ncbi:Phosphoglycerate dehydrogenase [Ferrithrix thermotolerans DSM 19514]|uniref:Phosphoglycerate dehydrogenase n=1 Tax=Ferrithrix thermotolerans DSM 19514 TaxID=1121881 RepID=A0A1M4UA56_9ACTN|nr:2-hydroxyacid dehydrogenase [Ferrithrix thermotolerans]SHE53741.1 Phosphoglycerate dehydrogenase [Ferrithrix thermotolerans DSM 19514]